MKYWISGNVNMHFLMEGNEEESQDKVLTRAKELLQSFSGSFGDVEVRGLYSPELTDVYVESNEE